MNNSIGKTNFKLSLLLITFSVAVFLTACKKESDSFSATAVSTRKLLYVVSGSCYAGGVATSTGASTVVAYDTSSGLVDHIVYRL